MSKEKKVEKPKNKKRIDDLIAGGIVILVVVAMVEILAWEYIWDSKPENQKPYGEMIGEQYDERMCTGYEVRTEVKYQLNRRAYEGGRRSVDVIVDNGVSETTYKWRARGFDVHECDITNSDNLDEYVKGTDYYWSSLDIDENNNIIAIRFKRISVDDKKLKDSIEK